MPTIPATEQPVTTKQGSPWSGLGRKLTDAEWEALKVWRKENPNLKYKRGDMRDDGRAFFHYENRVPNGEVWVTIASLVKARATDLRISKRRRNGADKEKINRQQRESSRKRMLNPEYKKRVERLRYKWRAENRDRVNRYFECNRRIRRSSRHPNRNKALIKRLYQICRDISKNIGSAQEMDHIIPLAAGGWHHELNLQLLPRGMNRVKKDNPFWMHDGCYLDWRNVRRELWPEALRPEYERLILLHPKPVHAIRTGFKGQPPVNQIAA